MLIIDVDQSIISTEKCVSWHIGGAINKENTTILNDTFCGGGDKVYKIGLKYNKVKLHPFGFQKNMILRGVSVRSMEFLSPYVIMDEIWHSNRKSADEPCPKRSKAQKSAEYAWNLSCIWDNLDSDNQ